MKNQIVLDLEIELSSLCISKYILGTNCVLSLVVGTSGGTVLVNYMIFLGELLD